MRPTLTIRKADPSDLPAVESLRLDATAWLASIGSRQWQPGEARTPTTAAAVRAIERGTCYLAYEGDQLVGTVTADDYADPEFWTPAERRQPALYLHRMIVARSASGRDLGARLIDWADEFAAASGRQLLRLDAWKSNAALHAYYLRQGFRHVRTIDLPHRGSGALFERPVTHGLS